ncbi:MAG: ATP-binding domain-containing protein, partial [Spirochaetia bacterium]|nr:ATP-binding domain-containing protein [Spirochaetia bacterium]
ICNSLTDKKSESVLQENVSELFVSRRFKSSGGIGNLSQLLREKYSGKKISEENLVECFNKDDIRIYTGAFQTQFDRAVIEGFSGIINAKSPEEALYYTGSFRVLAAHRRGIRGLESVNDYIISLLRRKNLIGHSGRFYSRIPIMVQKNDYSLNLFNGDTGILWNNGNEIRAYFYDSEDQKNIRSFPPDMISFFEPSFAMTVHKSQGSEFNSVLFMLPENTSPILSIELFYTALTRAKEKFVVFGEEKLLFESLNKKIIRKSGLRDALLKKENGSVQYDLFQ